MRYERLKSLIQNHMQQECNESARELRIALYKCDQQQQHRSASRQINETAGDCGCGDDQQQQHRSASRQITETAGDCGCGDDEAGIKRRNVWQ